MTRRVSVIVAFGVLMAVMAASAAAAPPVTLVLKSGEKVRGNLVDLGGGGYTIRVGGADQNIATADVAVIDFTGAPFRAAELDRVRQGQALAVFHSGDVFEGRLIDIGGTDPLRMTFRTPGGNRDVNSSELSRVYLSRWQGMPESGQTEAAEAGPSLDPGGDGLAIPANQCWTNTLRSVRQGQRVTFNWQRRDPVEHRPGGHRGRGGVAHGKAVGERPHPGSAGRRPHRPGRERPAVRDRRPEDGSGDARLRPVVAGRQRRPLRRQPRPVQGADQHPAIGTEPPARLLP